MMENKFMILDLKSTCNICNKKLFNDIFFSFNCKHNFHKLCLKKKFEEMHLYEKLENIK